MKINRHGARPASVEDICTINARLNMFEPLQSRSVFCAPLLAVVLALTGVQMAEASSLMSPIQQDSSCGPGARFCDGSAPEPKVDDTVRSYGVGYINFSPQQSCSGGSSSSGPPGGGPQQPQSIDPIPPSPNEAVNNSWMIATPTQIPTITPTATPTTVPDSPQEPPCDQAFSADRFSTSSAGSGNDLVLGSRFRSDATWPVSVSDGWHPDPDNPGKTKFGLAHNSGGTHVVATLQRLQNQATRSGGFVTDGNKNHLRPFCYIGDAVNNQGNPLPRKTFYPADDSPLGPRSRATALVSYIRESACLNCKQGCAPRRPIVQCQWHAVANHGKLNITVREFSPVVDIWDGVFADGVENQGDYNIRMCLHEYYYLGQNLCNSDCSNWEGKYNDKQYTLPSWNRRFWGRISGDGGFRERSAHNIYYKDVAGGCNDPYGCSSAHESFYYEDPGAYKWDVCTGNVPDSPCEYPNYDFGDAPNGYPSASHRISDLYIGTYDDGPPDPDFAQQSHPTALGDDSTNIDDESDFVINDAVPPDAPMVVSCHTAQLKLYLHLPIGTMYTLGVWADFNGDGDFEDHHEDLLSEPVQSFLPETESKLFEFSVYIPCHANGDTVFRARLSDNSTITSEGFGGSGEVEDFIVDIENYMHPSCSRSASDDYLVLVAGFSASQEDTACDKQFGKLRRDLASWGWSPSKISAVANYSMVRDCDFQLEDYPTFDPIGPTDYDTPIADLARALGWYIYEEIQGVPGTNGKTLKSNPPAVDAAGFSMGGIVLRYMAGVSAYWRDHPNADPEDPTQNPYNLPYIPLVDLDDVYTVGSPHSGIVAGDVCQVIFGLGSHCRELRTQSSVMTFLKFTDWGRNPQGTTPTQWTAVNSEADILGAFGSMPHADRSVVYSDDWHQITHFTDDTERGPIPDDDRFNLRELYYFAHTSECEDFQKVTTNACPVTIDCNSEFPRVNWHAAQALSGKVY